MVIDFEKIAEAHLEGFKGGEGKLDTRNYVPLPAFMYMRATARWCMW